MKVIALPTSMYKPAGSFIFIKESALLFTLSLSLNDHYPPPRHLCEAPKKDFTVYIYFLSLSLFLIIKFHSSNGKLTKYMYVKKEEVFSFI